MSKFRLTISMSIVGRILTLSLLFTGLQSCVLYPPYKRPIVEIPEKWRVNADESSSYANIRWWNQFNDPVLDELIDAALLNNNDLKVAILNVQVFYGQLLMAQSQLYPQINGSFSGLREKSSLSFLPGSIEFPSFFWLFNSLISASYDLDLWGEVRSASDAALAQLLASVESRRTAVLELVTAVAIGYIQLRQYDAQLTVSRQTLQSRKDSYELANLRFHGGLTSELEAKQAEAEMDTALVQVLQLEVNVAQQENMLSVLVGRPPEPIKRGSLLANMTLPPSVPAGLPSQVLEQRPEIRTAEYNLMAANADIGVAKAQFFPNISLTGNYGNEGLQLNKLFSGPAVTWQYAGAVTQPFFTGGRLTGQLDVAEAQKWEAYYTYRDVVLNAFAEVDDALIANEKSRELVVTQKARVDALEIALHLAKLQYENGQVDYLNVLDVERTLFTAQLDLVQAEAYTFLSMINIYKALGGGWVIESDNEALALYQSLDRCEND